MEPKLSHEAYLQALRLGGGQNVTFADLTLTGGSVANSQGIAQGGALLDQGGNVSLNKVIVQGNTVKGAAAEGGGVYVSGAGSLSIRDSILSDNSAQGVPGANGTAPGQKGSSGGSAFGGGLYVTSSGWTVTLIGDTLSGNTAIGGNGGNGAAGSNATAPYATGGNGAGGGYGGEAWGGAAFLSSYGNDHLTILNDLSAPLTDPSTWIDNSAQAGAGGNGGAGGKSTGTAHDSVGGQEGYGGDAFGGALYVSSSSSAPVIIGNSAFYANTAAGGNNGTAGLPGTGGQPNPPPSPSPEPAGDADGGGLSLSDDNVTIVNSTVAANTAAGGVGSYGARGNVWGGGISIEGDVIRGPRPMAQPSSPSASLFVNNTITQNSANGMGSFGSGVFGVLSNSTFVNNLIQGNRSIDSSASDLARSGPP